MASRHYKRSKIRLTLLCWLLVATLVKAATTEIMSDSPEKIGGGAINEKKRSFRASGTNTVENQDIGYNPLLSKSHLMHAIEGLDRYPNYLSRWSLEDTNMLERGLEERLAMVKSQKKQVIQERNAVQRLVARIVKEYPELKDLLKPPQSWQEVKDNILDPRASKAIFKANPFLQREKPNIQDVISGKTLIELNVGQLEHLMEEEMFDVYSFPLLKPSFCAKLRLFFQRVMTEVNENADYSQLSRQIIIDLDNLGFKWLNDLLFHLVIRPMSRHLFKTTEMGEGDLDFRHGYIAAYSAKPTDTKPRQRLVPHTDDSEVTLNLCIGEQFEGGELQFWGLRGTADEGTLVGNFRPKIGRALLHAGRHLHEVQTVTEGNRFALIIWSRSWSGIRAKSCPCCWLNRREDAKKSCICGPRWN